MENEKVKNIIRDTRRDAKYEILARQYAAYDLMISQFNSASSMFSEMIAAENNAY